MRPTMRNRVPNTFKTLDSEKGFAIPIALGMGLVMLLLGMTAIVRSQGDQRVAVDKKFSAQARTAAEIGVTRIQDFLNRYRAAAAAPACVVWPSSGYGACTDTTGISWGFPNNITNLCSSDRTTVDGFATNDWQSAGTAGDYRLVSYTYSSSTGTLTVEGRVNGGDTNEARSRLQVTIPVVSPTGVPVASLWVTGSITGSPQINSDVVSTSTSATDCTGGGTATFPPSTTTKLLNVVIPQSSSSPLSSMPAVKAKPTTATATNFYTLDKISTIPGNELPRTTGTGGTGYTSNDLPDSDGVYKYIVTSTAANPFDGSFKVTPGKKVSLWVKGNIDLSSRTIVNQCGSAGSTSDCGPFDVKIYPETSGITSPIPTLTLDKGTAVCDVFFHLPDYAVNFVSTTGTTSAQDCGSGTKNTGVYWVKSWSGANGTTTVIDPPRATWGTAISSVNLTSFTAPPLTPQIGPGSNWDTQSN
jgi:Tfp pilus assembly protein PilX